MTVYLTLLPAGHASHELLPNTDAATGIVTVTARPTDRTWAVGQDLLRALGINPDLATGSTGHAEDLRAARAWLHAHDVTLLRVRHADNFHGTGLLDQLVALCRDLSITLLLTTDDEPGRALLDWAADHGHHLLAPDLALRLADTLHHRTTPGALDEDDPAADFPQNLPTVDFPLFRARCRDLLPPDQHARADELYRHTFRTVTTTPPRDSHAAAALIGGLIAAHRSPGEALVITRAAQAALFTQALQLKVSLPTMLRAVTDQTHRRLTTAEIRALRCYRLPATAATVVLADANLPLSAIQALTVEHVDDHGQLRGVPEAAPLHPEAHLYLRAQRTYRLLEHTNPDDPLIPGTTTRLAKTLRTIAADLNLPTAAKTQRADQSRTGRWQRDLGATLMTLDGFVLHPHQDTA